MELRGHITGLIIGIVATFLFFVMGSKMGVFNAFAFPEKGSFEAQAFCDQLFKEGNKEISGDAVSEWVIPSILTKFKMELSSIPEAGQGQLRKAVQPYLDELKSGTVSQEAIVNIAYLVNKARPENETK